MSKQIDIDVASFFDSGYKKLVWHRREDKIDKPHEETETSVLKTDHDSLPEALKEHLYHLGESLRETGLVDYNITLSFDNVFENEQKQEFTTAFKAFNTRDESN